MSFKTARIKAGLKQGEAAERIGVSRISVYNWERGRGIPNGREQLMRVAAIYGVTVDELFRDEKSAGENGEV